ncbi:hypothetical protein [Streptomyces sp. NPDC048248]|uniref:hypothetical protein n=1 Tax=Streptomyces sp. NPDC048248 TaxID=3365523 RepID=UPI00371A63DC
MLIGNADLSWGKTLGYLTDAPACVLVFFHLWSDTDPGAEPSWPPLHEQTLLLAVRHGDRRFAASFTFIPEGGAAGQDRELLLLEIVDRGGPGW